MPFEAFVTFVDMLGFADLVEEEGGDLGDLNPILKSVELYSPSPGSSLLGNRFVNFHRCLQSARTKMQEAGAGTAIIFSDSAYLALENLDLTIDVARSLMYSLVVSDVPARMGIAHGSFRGLYFGNDSSDQLAVHMSQFLGTGVVRAFETERCGLPGLRILLHPNLEPLLDRSTHRVVTVADRLQRAPQVQSELNYLETDVSFAGPHYDDVILFDSLRTLQIQANDALWYHYEATFNALNVMREQFGYAPYPWEKYLDRDAFEKAQKIEPEPYKANQVYPKRVVRS